VCQLVGLAGWCIGCGQRYCAGFLPAGAGCNAVVIMPLQTYHCFKSSRSLPHTARSDACPAAGCTAVYVVLVNMLLQRKRVTAVPPAQAPNTP
jgi:hypothetical protein